ncbi:MULTISPECIES: peroxiredoxin [Methylomonas]|uniref:thioredoxin-dependent peroxiredoxin n=2 Tax=Methylomonas TaxID=416 RepID=A0A140E467_9GAMM|nr:MULTISPECIES: peroxiredoxin [Methylomonas]AMK75191.1 alkyl hydroperoxide reductase [Methylomonas denitrificans]OAH99410.1 peroxiredoxin [Methylomonas methanica]TCV85062.1 peroxiredoxin Q/BCP [Methylomonas methanica]
MQKLDSTFKRLLLIVLVCSTFTLTAQADALQPGQPAPLFQLPSQDGNQISLAARQGKGWTVLYFYPKAGTPGCTTQACAFRDAIKLIRDQNAEVYGISTDDVKDLLAFHQQHKLTFSLLSDQDAKVSEAYGVKMPILNMAKRWTFIVDPNLTIRRIDDDVDPALDAKRVAEMLKQLQASAN